MGNKTAKGQPSFRNILPQGRGQRSDSGMIDQRESFQARSEQVKQFTDETPHGAMYISSSVATTVVAGTWTKVLGTTTLDDASHHEMPSKLRDIASMDMPENNRLRYRGNHEQHFIAMAAITATSDTNNTILKTRYAVNGATKIASETQRKIGTAGDIGAYPVFHILELGPRDYVEMWIDTDKNADITISYMNIILMGYF